MFYADTEKFFDKLWVGDVIIEVWRRGTNSGVVIRGMYRKANNNLCTSRGLHGHCVQNIVSQGTVYDSVVVTGCSEYSN